MPKPEQIKEQIKLYTEFLKFYFILTVAIGTGVVTLATREQFAIVQIIGIILGIAAITVTLILITGVNKKIKALINQLT